ncbi:MAG: YdcF family protein [Terriglobia bacterium]
MRWGIVIIAAVIVAVVLFLRYGGDLLVANDRLPSHAQVAVVLNGSAAGMRARTAGALQLSRRGVVDHVIISVPPTTYWGESVPEVAHRYFENELGPQQADQILFCVSKANSTIQEAGAIMECLRSRGWTEVIIVTSNFHTRRAGRIWRAAVRSARPPVHIWMHGVADGSFQPRGWWRKRIYAKTWLLETSKLLWETVFGAGPWKGRPVKGQLVQPTRRTASSS